MQPIYHFISHSHWDREWYKSFEVFRLDLVDMINSLLHIFQTDPDYKHFTLDGQTSVLEDYAEIMPGHTDKLARLIQKGRISIGPWYVLPDEFLVSGESTVRNLLRGKKVGAVYGPVMEIGYIPDSFGHLAMLPAILQGFDMDTTIVYRGFGGEPGQEKSEYRWRSPDGSEVLMIHLPPNGYGDAYIGKNDPEAFRQKARELKEILDPRATTPHRLCMNGGDHHFPEPYLPQALRVMSEAVEGQFIHSSLTDYVHAVKAYLAENEVALNRIEGELRWGYRYAFAVQSGVFSARMYLKQANRANERLLARSMEPLLIWATVSGREHLVPMAERAWKLLLQNHPHDSICGCSIDPVHREMTIRFEKCEQVAEAVIDKALKHLYPDAWEAPEHILTFNPAPAPVSTPFAAAIEFFRQQILVGLNPNVHPEPAKPLVSGFRLLDASGNEVPYQVVRHEPEGHGLRYSDYSYPSKGLVERFHLLVDGQSLPGLGFARYRVEQQEQMPEYTSDLQAGDRVLENRFLRVQALDNGALQITDKRSGQTFPALHVFEDGGDAGDEYNYSYPPEDRLLTSENLRARITLLEQGPLRAVLQIELDFPVPQHLAPSRQRRSDESATLPIRTRVILYHNQPRVEFETRVDNRAEDHRLRVLFPTGFATRSSFADSQFGITRREHRVVDPAEFSIEVPSTVHPMQRGVTILDGERGFTVATAGLPEYELKAEEPGTLAITLLRCVGRLSGGDLLTRRGGEAGWITETPEAQCLGQHTFRYAIIPHTAEDFHEYGYLNEQLERFLLPVRTVRRGGDPAHDLQSFGLELQPASLVLSAFKPAEDGKGFILRAYNPTDRAVAGTIRLARPLQHVFRTGLNERNHEAISPTGEGTLQLTVEPRAIFSLRLVF